MKHLPEIEVSLASIGPWRASFSGYDWIHKPRLFQAMGGAPGMLWHEKAGPVLSASLACYFPAEAAHMQAAPDGEDFPLTLRVESRGADATWEEGSCLKNGLARDVPYLLSVSQIRNMMSQSGACL